MNKQYIYLDHAATTPLAPQVLKAMEPYLTAKFYNPSAPYGPARDVAKDLEAARRRIAHWLGVRPTEIIFTAGGTEANNLAVAGIMGPQPKANMIVSSIEHDAILEPAKEFEVRTVPVRPDGLIDVNRLESIIDNNTVLVSIMYANNEIGTIQPLRQIGHILDAVKKKRLANNHQLPLYFHSDASQAAAYLDLHVNRLGLDLMTINGSKMYGPKQTGVLFAGSKVQLQPQILGGGQERGRRSGTENIAGSIGLSRALDLVQSRRAAECKRLQTLQKLFIDLIKETIPRAVINGSFRSRLPNNVHLTIPGEDNERLIILLEERGVLCAAGSACSADSGEPSHVLKALGLDETTARSSLRFTMGGDTTETDIRKTAAMLKEIINQ